MADLSDAEVTVIALDGTDGWLHALGRVLEVLPLLLLLCEVLAVGDGKHHHADAREDVAVIVGQG